MSAFKLAEVVMALLISGFLWIPLSYGIDLAVTAVNSGITDADAIAHNNQLGQLFYYTLFFIILACVIYVLKSRKGEDDQQVAYIQQPTFQVIRARLSGGAPGRITLVLCMVLMLTVPMAAAWPTDMAAYGKRNCFYVNGSSSGAAVLFTLTYDADMQSDFDDLVFKDGTGDSANNVSHFVEYVDDGTLAWVWGAFDSDTTHCMYYGNPSTGSTSDGAGTFQSFDDFEDYSVSSSIAGQGGWLISSGIDVFTVVNSNCEHGDQCIELTETPSGDSCIQNNNPTDQTDSVFIVYQRQDGSTDRTQAGIWDNDTSSFGGFMKMEVDGDWNYFDTSTGVDTGINFATDKWYRIMFNVTSNTYDGQVTDMTDLSEDVTFSNAGIRSGYYVDGIDQWWLCSPNAPNTGTMFDLAFTTKYVSPTPTVTFLGEEDAPVAENITLTIGVSPSTLYNLTAANFSIYYNETSGNAANITINLTSDRTDNWTYVPEISYVDVASDTTLYYYVLPGNYTKHNNITLVVNVTTEISEVYNTDYTIEINNTNPSTPSGDLYPRSVIIGDNLTTNVSSTDDDQDAITYWYRFGWDNNTNITNWKLTDNLTILSGYENDTLRAWFKAGDGEGNSSADYLDMNVTNLQIALPVDGESYIGKDLYFAFYFDTEYYQECEETVAGTTYPLGYINTDQNHSRTVWYDEDNVYTVTCYSWEDPSLTYNKSVNFTNYFANWSVSMYTENDWNTPLNITEANLSIFINCEGGSQYVYNFTGTTFYGVKPECDVQSITAKVDYSTDSYVRERSVPDCLECDIRMYMVDALIYTVLQIPIYMSDYNYFDTRIELYKLSGGNHYTIAQGYFDVEHKYVTYLTKDNTYYIRLDEGSLGSQVRDIGYLYAASATAQYLSLSEINLRPDITLISDNLLMAAEFDDPTANTSTLRITYEDLINVTTSVRVRVYSDTNNTAWYDQTFYGYDNLTISINNVNTTRHSVRFTVNHEVLGNSPVDFTVGVGAFGSDVDFGLSAANQWILAAAGFVVMLLTALIIVPEIRIYGILALLVELGVFVGIRWFAFAPETVLFFIAALVAGFVYEIKYKGVT